MTNLNGKGEGGGRGPLLFIDKNIVLDRILQFARVAGLLILSLIDATVFIVSLIGAGVFIVSLIDATVFIASSIGAPVFISVFFSIEKISANSKGKKREGKGREGKGRLIWITPSPPPNGFL